MHIATACTRSYLPRVRVLADSISAQAPGSRVTALVLDAVPGQTHSESFEVIAPEDIFDATEFARMATAYDVVELSTAMKPRLLRHLLDATPTVHFVDPDVCFYGDPGFLDPLATEWGIVLTPHLCTPPRRQRGGGPGGEDAVLPAGVFNLGYIGVSRGAEPGFLAWWEDRLARDCLNDVASARFVDQRWVDLVPGYFTHHVVRHPGVNVAWWNMPERAITRENDTWLAAGEPLVFLHASGVDPHDPDGVSRHHDGAHSFQPEADAPLRALLADYRTRVIAQGHGTVPPPDAGLGRAVGLHVTQEERRRYRSALLRHEQGGGDEPPNPFVHGVAAFTDWLDDEGPRAGEVASPGGRRARGVNLVGHFSSATGVGMVARLMSRALGEAGVPHTTHDLDEPLAGRSAHRVPWHHQHNGLFDTTIVCENADGALHTNHRLHRDLRECRRIGIWWWETEEFPRRFDDSFQVVDEVWTGSGFTQRAIAARADRPVRVMPMPVVVTADPDPGLREELGIPAAAFLVASVISLDSVFERKNPLGVIAAYRDAFDAGDGAALVMKVTGRDDGTRIERIRSAASGRPDIQVIDATWSIERVHALMSACDCLLSLHRSEGFGLTMAEAMAYGRPVVATAYGGNLQFMDDDCGYVIPWSPVAITRDARPYREGGTWADPDIPAAAAALREVRADPVGAAERGATARRRMEAQHSPLVAGQVMRDMLGRHEQTAPVRRLIARLRRNGTHRTPGAIGPAGGGTTARTPGYYHSIALPDGRRLDGDWSFLDLDAYLGRVPLAGRRVLDASTATGALAFAAEQRGAREVVALDLPLDADYDARVPVSEDTRERAREWRTAVRDGFHMCHAALGSEVRHASGDLRDLPRDLGRFDVGLLGNVLQHLRDPAGALLALASTCNVVVVTEADWMHGQIDDDIPALFMFPSDQPYSWYQARPAWVRDLLKRNGFEDVSVAHHVQRYNGHVWPEAEGRPDPVDITHFTVVAWQRDVPVRDRRLQSSRATPSTGSSMG